MENHITITGERGKITYQITLEQLQRIYKEQSRSVLEANLDEINRTINAYSIGDNKFEVAAFLAQIGHESACLRYNKENLNYSAKALRSVFGKYFRTVPAERYARNPEMIANRVYGNRMGNGPEQSGDGWKFRGRGYIQLTGRNNYEAFADYLGWDLDETIEYLETIPGAWDCAGWYWRERNLDRFDDSPSMFKKLTKMINGGYNGLKHREELYQRALAVL